MGARHERQLQRGHEPRSTAPRDHAQRHPQGRADAGRHPGVRRRARPRRRRRRLGRNVAACRNRDGARRRRGPAHAFDLEHAAVTPLRRRGRPRDQRLRDAERARGRGDARAPRMASHPRERSGHAAARRRGPARARRPPVVPRVPPAPPRVVHLGSDARRGCQARRDPRVPARKRRPLEGGRIMALVRIGGRRTEGGGPEEALTERAEVAAFLARHGIDYERWKPAHAVPADAPVEEILDAYDAAIAALKTRGGYVSADVIDVKPDTPNLDMMLAKFSREHWHDEDEVRFIIEGRGLFHVHPADSPVFAIEVEAGDLIRVPRGTHHWFDLCSDRRIRAIRLFQDVSGWTPHYTGSGVDKGFEPVCFGPAYVAPR